jgi:hypothetical protein
MTMSYSVSAIRPDREYAPVRSFEDSAGINQGELIGSNASFRAVLKRVKIVAPTDSLVLAHTRPGAQGYVVLGQDRRPSSPTPAQTAVCSTRAGV